MEKENEKELVELYEAAKKAADASTDADSSHEESRCLDALEQLKKFPVNYKILVNTQVFFFTFCNFDFFYFQLFLFEIFLLYIYVVNFWSMRYW